MPAAETRDMADKIPKWHSTKRRNDVIEVRSFMNKILAVSLYLTLGKRPTFTPVNENAGNGQAVTSCVSQLMF